MFQTYIQRIFYSKAYNQYPKPNMEFAVRKRKTRRSKREDGKNQTLAPSKIINMSL